MQVRTRLGDELERLSRGLMVELESTLARPDDDAIDSEERRAIQEQIGLLGQITAGLVEVQHDDIPADRAGFGSTVVVDDLDSGETATYTLMVGDFIDLEAGQVSLGSAIGQALLGRAVGETVEVELPLRTRRLRIVSLRTLPQLLGLAEAGAEAEAGQPA